MRPPNFWWSNNANVFSVLLSPFAYFYGKISERPFGKGYQSHLKVLCIGNFVIGGAGKTPLAMFLAEKLQQKGYKICFLTRGFKGKYQGPHLVDSEEDSAEEVGDEPLLLASKAQTIIAKDRVAGIKFIESNLDVDLVIMDDGFQSAKIKPSHALLVVDDARGLGNSRTLPSGPLRAPLKTQIHYASALFLINDGREQAENIKSLVKAFEKKSKPVLRGKLCLLDKPDEKQSYMAFSGIGDPEKFFHSLKLNGFNISEAHSYPDHHFFSEMEAKKLLARATEILAIPVTTEKDAVRLRGKKNLLSKLYQKTKIVKVTIIPQHAKKFENWLLTLDL